MKQAELDRHVADDLAPRLRSVVTRLNRRLRSSSLGGVSPGQASALAMIERLGAPSLGELAAAEMVRPPSMSRLIDALEGDGYVQRRVDESDRRSQRISVTGAGRRELVAIRRRKTAFLEARLAALAPADRGAVERALGVLERIAQDP